MAWDHSDQAAARHPANTRKHVEHQSPSHASKRNNKTKHQTPKQTTRNKQRSIFFTGVSFVGAWQGELQTCRGDFITGRHSPPREVPPYSIAVTKGSVPPQFSQLFRVKKGTRMADTMQKRQAGSREQAKRRQHDPKDKPRLGKQVKDGHGQPGGHRISASPWYATGKNK